jgi:hypothetical protein
MEARAQCLTISSSDGYGNRNHRSRSSPTTPTMDAITPPSNIHIALSVGEPVKKREMSEVNDVDAMTPNTISTIPAARRASETALLMFFPFMN